MQVLITGASGFIGRRLIQAVPEHWNVTAVSRRPVDGAHVRAVAVDLEVAGLPTHSAGPYDVVLHLAGNANHGLALTEPARDLAATGMVAANLFASVQTRRVIVLSSAAVYAGRRGQVDPNEAVAPEMAYAAGKLYVELLSRSLQARNLLEGLMVVRLYNAFGPGERDTRLIPRIAKALRTGNEFVLTAAPDSLSDPVHVDEVVRHLVAAAESTASGTYDLCGGDPRPMADQVRRVAHVLGGDLVVREEAAPGEVPIGFWSDASAISRAVGVSDVEPLVAGVERYAREMGWRV